MKKTANIFNSWELIRGNLLNPQLTNHEQIR